MVGGTLGPALKLHLAAELSSVETARLAMIDFLAPYQLSGRTVFSLELILEEMLMNVVMHGSDSQHARHGVHLTVEADDTQVLMCLEDRGVAFDPLSAPEPRLPASLDDAAVGGLGLMLVKKHARHLAYERRDDRNILNIAVAR